MSEDRTEYVVMDGVVRSVVTADMAQPVNVNIPRDALWPHQRLHVCGECQDCKWGVEEDDATGRRCCHPGADSPTRCFRWPSTFGCVHWEAKPVPSQPKAMIRCCDCARWQQNGLRTDYGLCRGYTPTTASMRYKDEWCVEWEAK